jgi:ribosomal protein S18 acetylase RimI-like enzyme
MAFLARLALERGCGRFDWTAETDNPETLAFYDRLGARRVEEKVYYRFDGEALNALAEKRLFP